MYRNILVMDGAINFSVAVAVGCGVSNWDNSVISLANFSFCWRLSKYCAVGSHSSPSSSVSSMMLSS